MAKKLLLTVVQLKIFLKTSLLLANLLQHTQQLQLMIPPLVCHNKINLLKNILEIHLREN